MKPIRCLDCTYYHVTWDAEMPYGCSKLGFKTHMEPSNYVIKVSGNICQSFNQKKIKKK